MHTYNNPLSITSQFSFCGLPFRLDTYSGCAIGCKYCFARLRGGNINSKKLKVASANSIIKVFENVQKFNNKGIISEFIRKRVPLHFGGMSDPFQSIEKIYEVSYTVLKYLKSINYPVIISTKSDLIGTDKYLKLFNNYENLIIQVSFSTLDESKSKILEPNSPNPIRLLSIIKQLTNNNIKVSVRWQPYIIGVSENPKDFISEIASVNVKHIGFEHLKLSLEKNSDLENKIKVISGQSIYSEYKKLNSITNGREYVLPIQYKRDIIFEIKKIAENKGIYIGFADNEFQYLSDFDCCCSGIDMYNGFENWYKPQISYAIKKAYKNGLEKIKIENIIDEWNSNGSIDKYVNSKSRIIKTNKQNTMLDYVLERWNNLDSPFNPTKYFNVKFEGDIDDNGYKIYKFDKEPF